MQGEKEARADDQNPDLKYEKRYQTTGRRR
jgi:hypothetical protein